MALDDQPQRQMLQYRCHKVVWALKIARSHWLAGGHRLKLVPEDKSFAPFLVDEDWVRRCAGSVLDGGYYVVYADGFKSFSPAKAFEEGYTRIDGDEADALAKRFHETYERLAPDFGYETRKDSAVPWENVPEKNKALMRAVCAELIRG